MKGSSATFLLLFITTLEVIRADSTDIALNYSLSGGSPPRKSTLSDVDWNSERTTPARALSQAYLKQGATKEEPTLNEPRGWNKLTENSKVSKVVSSISDSSVRKKRQLWDMKLESLGWGKRASNQRSTEIAEPAANAWPNGSETSLMKRMGWGKRWLRPRNQIQLSKTGAAGTGEAGKQRSWGKRNEISCDKVVQNLIKLLQDLKDLHCKINEDCQPM